MRPVRLLVALLTGWLALTLLLVAAVCLSPAAHAQVVTCPGGTVGASYSTCATPSQSSAPDAATLVVWCGAPAAIGSGIEACPSATWLPWDNAQGYSKLLTTYGGWQTRDAVTFVSTPAPPPDPTPAPAAPYQYACWPLKAPTGVRIFAVPVQVSTRFDVIAVWTCDTPRGIKTESRLFTWRLAQPFLFQTGWTNASAQAAADSTDKPLTQAEAEWSASIRAPFLATAKVSPNGTNATRPVYALKADGTRGSQVGTAPVGSPCLVYVRATGTNYFGITPTTVALCTLASPLPLN